MGAGPIVLIVAGVLVLLLLASAIRIVREYQRVVVFRLGRLRGARGPGLVLIIPLAERTRWVSLQVDTADIPGQDLITKDNVTIRVEAAVFYRVVDPVKAVVAIRDYRHAILRIAQTTLRATLGRHELDDVLANKPRSTNSSSRSSTERPSPGASRWWRSRPRTWTCRTR